MPVDNSVIIYHTEREIAAAELGKLQTLSYISDQPAIMTIYRKPDNIKLLVSKKDQSNVNL